MSYDPLSSHLTDQKQEGATAKQTKLSPDLLGALSPSSCVVVKTRHGM